MTHPKDLPHREQTFRTDIGVNATIQRAQAGPEISAKPNRMLVDLGLSFQEIEEYKLKGYESKGSAAVQIFTHDLLNQLDFISQTEPLVLYRCPQNLAQRAFDDLLGTLKRMYGHKVGKLRSGF